MTEFFKLDRHGPIAVITIDRADAMNALDAPRHFALSAIIDAFAADPEQRVAIITGAGERAFCAGNDLKQRLESGAPAVPDTGFGGLTSRPELDKPVIAAVNGMAIGGGFELALACDLVVAADHATFALPEARVGLAALAGGVVRLPQYIGPKRTMELVLTGRRVTAVEGQAMGFVNAVTTAQDLMPAAMALARKICEAAPLSIRATKALMRLGLDAQINAALPFQMDLVEVQQMRASEDAREGPRAFAEKRQPQWAGR